MFRQFRPILRGEFIVAGGDCSQGAGDWSVTQFVSKTFRDVPLVYSSKQTASKMTLAIHPVLEKIFDKTLVKPLVAYERNNGGVYEMDKLGELNRSGKYDLFVMPEFGRAPKKDGKEPEPVRLGWDTNTATRPVMLSELKAVIDGGTLTVYDRQTVSELFTFIMVQTNTAWKAQAERHSHDDHVMALAIAVKLMELSPDLVEIAARSAVPKDPDERQFKFNGRRRGY